MKVANFFPFTNNICELFTYSITDVNVNDLEIYNVYAFMLKNFWSGDVKI